ncbi:MAG TPA: NAD(+)/NADH kinase [Candidatus Limnocylindria bacterium]
MKLAFAVRPDWDVAVGAARDAATRARTKGHEVVELKLDSPSLAREVAGAEVAIIFGGDGTMLRAARALAPLAIPMLGVNLGRLGFLAGGSIDELDGLLAEIAAGRCTTEERTLLEAHVHRKGVPDLDALALNDVVVARGREVRSIHIGVTIDGAPFTTYWSDGLIVATATGSTAYGMSVGGPLIIPSSRAMMIVPIAPHLSFPNAVVLDVDQTIALEVLDEPARLSLDGQEEHDLHVGDRIDVRRAKPVARFVRTATMRPFLTLLRKKILKEEGGPV